MDGAAVVQAFPEETAPRYLVRDRDRIYGDRFRRMLEILGVEEVVTAARSPWQNAYAERLIGSLRRECLDHIVVLGEIHLSESWLGTSSITTGRAATFHWWATRRNPGRHKDRNSAGWSSFPRLAGCIIDTSAPPLDAPWCRRRAGVTALSVPKTCRDVRPGLVARAVTRLTV